MSKPDLSKVKAGKYRLISRRWDQILSKPGEPFDFVRHRAGDVVDLNVEDARRLVSAGAVVAEDEYARLEQQRAAAATPPVFDTTGLAALREQLGLDEDADQKAILAAVQGLAAQTPLDAPKSDKIGDILGWVGNDAEKAAAALALERQEKGDDARPTLVTGLEKVIAEAGGGS